jgi:protocatechuate 3,4-dioxygenase beta subunit
MTRAAHVDDHDGDLDRGLAFDLPRLLGRRHALQVLAGGGLGTLVAACGSGGSGGSDAGAADPTTTEGTSGEGTSSESSESSSNSSEVIPEETAGPYPGDGSNGPNVLEESGVVRSDIRSSFGDMQGTAEGVPLTVTLKILDVSGSGGGGARPGAAVYAWHCDRDGGYSLYTVADQNYLRGVQEAGDDGTVTFTTIFPGCYPGRWPHVHFEVYESLAAATGQGGGGAKLATSQLALPEDTCREAYGADGYSASAGNLDGVSLDGDMVFSDGWSLEMATVTGSATDGYTATLNVPV